MGLLGTFIGGSLGLMLGGPLGGVIGATIGYNMTRGEEQPRHERQTFAGHQRPNPLHTQQTFLIALISLAAKVAKADGTVTPAEVQNFDNFLKLQLNMSAEERQVAATIFNEARDSDIPAEDFALQVRQILLGQPARKRDLITLLMSIAMADGHLHPAEEEMIKSIASTLGLSRSAYDAAVKMFSESDAVENPYEVLDLTADATDREVKKAYRKFARDYHPDMATNRGLGEDFKQFAAEKMRTVNAAYATIRKERGF